MMMTRAATLAAMMLMATALASAAPVVEEVKPKEVADRAWQKTRDKLRQCVTLDGFDANTPFKEALAFMSEKFGMTILLDAEAFKRELEVQEADNQPVKLAKMVDVRLENGLDRLLQTVDADFFVQSDGVINVVPRKSVVKHILAQKVSVSYEKKPVNEALRQLADTMGLSIVVDEKRAGDKAKTSVTVDLRNVSLEAAILMLADLAELKPVTIDRAVYVTTVDNAKTLNAELLKKKKEAEEEPKPPQS
jgi:hypothetical protein